VQAPEGGLKSERGGPKSSRKVHPAERLGQLFGDGKRESSTVPIIVDQDDTTPGVTER